MVSDVLLQCIKAEYILVSAERCVTRADVIAAYEQSCRKHQVQPIETVLQQLQVRHQAELLHKYVGDVSVPHYKNIIPMAKLIPKSYFDF